MEKEILELLKAMQNDIKSMNERLTGIEEGQQRIEKKLDGVHEQTADLTLKQWGSATSGQTVNLLPYKDTNYAVTLANGSKTKSSFVANATGDYFAVGKTVLG